MNKSSKQRLHEFINLSDVTEIPAVPIIAGDHAAVISDMTIKEVCISGKKLGAALVNTFHLYGHDLVVVFSDVTVEAEAMGVNLEFPEDSAPHICDIPELNKISSGNPETDGRMPEILKAAEICVNKIGNEVEVCTAIKDPFSLAMLVRGSEEFLRDCIKNPDLNKDILEITARNQLDFVKSVIERGSLPLIGAPFASGSLISPDVFAEFVTPWLSRITDYIHSKELPVFIHICGDSEVIFDKILELEPQLLSVDELDISRYSSDYSGKVMLMGNLSTSLISQGSPDEIAHATDRMIDSSEGHFIPATGCDIPPNTPSENVKAMINAVRKRNK